VHILHGAKPGASIALFCFQNALNLTKTTVKPGFVLKKQKKIPGLFQDWLKQIPGPKIYDIMS
jgi:hypothetical protein